MNENNRQEEEKPLLTLMKSLVVYVDNDGKTVLNNTQLLHILNKEFNVDIWAAHPLELEVNTNIIKKFLKQWPNWDKVDQYAQKSKTDPNIDIEAIFHREYESLRKYLQGMLDLSKDITKANIEKATKKLAKDLKESEDATTNVVLEVHCSRPQLNKLFFSQPHPQQDNTIFNLDRGDSKIQLRKCELESLFHWPNLSFNITIGPYVFTRTNKLHLQHTLINKKIKNASKDPPKISNGVHSRITNRLHYKQYRKSIKRLHAINYIQNIIQDNSSFKHSSTGKFLLSILKDLETGPVNIDQSNEYMYFPFQHAYVRYLRSDLNFDTTPSTTTTTSTEVIDYSKYSLHLEEIIIPSVVYKLKQSLLKISTAEVLKSFNSGSWIKAECLDCNEKFDKLETLHFHIVNIHCDEPDVQCMNCKMDFSWGLMANNCWKHQCVVKTERFTSDRK